MIRNVLATSALLLTLAARAASIEDPASWSRIRFGDSVILTDAKPEKATELARQLTVARALLDDLLPTVTADAARPEVFVLGRTQDAFRGLFDDTTRGDSAFGGELLLGSGAGSEAYLVTTATASQFATTARSLQGYKPPFGVQVGVYVRYVLSEAWKDMPFWLREGLSLRFTTFDVVGETARLGGVPLVVRAELDYGTTRLSAAAVLDFPKIRGGGRDPRGIVRAYGWAMVDALLEATPDGRTKLRRFVALLREGRPQADAWAEATGTDPQAFLDGALRRLGGGEIAASQYPLASFRLPAPTPAEAVPAAELFGVLAKTWLRLRPTEHAQAERRAGAALAADPGDARALWAMGEVRRRQGRLDEARDMAKRSRAAAGDRRRLANEAESLEALLGAAPQP